MAKGLILKNGVFAEVTASDTLDAVGGVLSNSLDALSAGALNIGASTATGITLGKSGLTVNVPGTLQMAGSTVWTAGNDGSGSGLDADLLEGLQGTDYLRRTANDTYGYGLSNQNVYLTFANPGVGYYNGFNFSHTSDTAGMYVTEYASDNTMYEFWMGDNPDTTQDFFSWRWQDYQGTNGLYQPLQIANKQIRFIGTDSLFYSNINQPIVGPFYTTSDITQANASRKNVNIFNTLGSLKISGTGTTTITALDLSGYTGSSGQVMWITLSSATTFDWGYGTTGTGKTAQQTGLAVATTAVTLSNGVKVTFSDTTGGVNGDTFQCRLYKAPTNSLGSTTVNGTLTSTGNVYSNTGWFLTSTANTAIRIRGNANSGNIANQIGNNVALYSGKIVSFYNDNLSSEQVSIDYGGNLSIKGLTVNTLSAPTGLALSTATTGGTLAAGTCAYQVTALGVLSGTETVPCAEVSITTTGTTSTVTLTWNAVSGAGGYKVYGRTAGGEQFMATVAAGTTTWTDTGSVTPSGAPPIINSTGKAIASGIAAQDIRNTNPTPNQVSTDKSVTAQFNNNFGIGTSWQSALTVSGWSGTGTGTNAYAVWQLVGGSAQSAIQDDWYLRSGYGSTWGSWHRVWHDGNLTKLSQLTNDPGYLTGNQTIAVTGDATGSGSTSIALTLANSGVAAGTYPKVTVNAKGLVTGGSALVAADIPGLDWSKIISGTPTTLAGYGITDAASLGTAIPLVDGTGSAGSGTTASRVDHVHPTDTSRAPTASPIFTGTVLASAIDSSSTTLDIGTGNATLIQLGQYNGNTSINVYGQINAGCYFFFNPLNPASSTTTTVPSAPFRMNYGYWDGSAPQSAAGYQLQAVPTSATNNVGDLVFYDYATVERLRLKAGSGNLLISSNLDLLSAGTLNIGTSTASDITLGSGSNTITLKSPSSAYADLTLEYSSDASSTTTTFPSHQLSTVYSYWNGSSSVHTPGYSLRSQPSSAAAGVGDLQFMDAGATERLRLKAGTGDLVMASGSTLRTYNIDAPGAGYLNIGATASGTLKLANSSIATEVLGSFQVDGDTNVSAGILTAGTVNAGAITGTSLNLGTGAVTNSGNISSTGILAISRNGPAIQLYGSDQTNGQTYMEFYPYGAAAGRKAYFGYPSAGTTSMGINNGAGDIFFQALGGSKVTLSNNIVMQTASGGQIQCQNDLNVLSPCWLYEQGSRVWTAATLTQAQAKSIVAMQNGTGSLGAAATSVTISCSGCTTGSTVIVTPNSNFFNTVCLYAIAGSGSFTVYASPANGTTLNFSYVVFK